MTCPRCQGALRGAKLADLSASVCGACAGVLVSQRDLIPILTALGRELASEIDVDTPLKPVADAGAGLHCPRCGKPMVNFGYMGTDVVFLDRCEGCEHIWADGEELGAAALLAARTSLRGKERARRSREELAALSKRVDHILLSRAMRAALFRLSIFL